MCLLNVLPIPTDKTASSSEAPQVLNDRDKLVKRSEIRKMHLLCLNYEEQQVRRNSKRHKYNCGLETSSQGVITDHMLSVSLCPTVVKNFWVYSTYKVDILYVETKDICFCNWSRSSILSIISQDKLGQLEIF